MIIFRLFFLCLGLGTGNTQPGFYSIKCIFSTIGVEKTPTTHLYEGNVALYSLANDIDLHGAVDVLQDSDLCSVSKKRDTRFSENMIALVRRGNCSFETKSRVAAEEGYDALIIVNSENVVFPPGGTDSNSLPTLMISNSFWTDFSGLCEEGSCPGIHVRLLYGEL
jgi:hypothetical protein